MLFKAQSTADKIEKPEVKQMYLTILQLLARHGFALPEVDYIHGSRDTHPI